MHPNRVQDSDRVRAGAVIASATLLVLGLAGCAAQLTRPASSDTEDARYVGVFTGQYVDGKPLYRFPPIHIVGSRSSVDD